MDNSYSDVYLNFINGGWKQGSSGSWDPSRNPARPTEILGKTTKSTTLDLTKAIESAEKARVGWTSLSRPRRGQLVTQVTNLLRSKTELFSKTLSRETGRPIADSREEVLKAVASLEYSASEARHAIGTQLPGERPLTLISTSRSPLGVVGIITGWAHPLLNAASQIAPALIEGNTVVFKPSSQTPATSALFVRLFEEAGFQPGVLNLIFGASETLSKTLCEDPRIRGISVLGSIETAQSIGAATTDKNIKTYFESSSKNAAVVLKDADLEQATDSIIKGAFSLSGQTPTAITRLVLSAPIAEAFLGRFKDKLKTLTGPLALMPLMNEKQFERVTTEVELAKKEGATPFFGESPAPRTAEQGFFVPPQVLAQVPPESRIAQIEIFGPVLSVFVANSNEEALQIANANRLNQATSLFTQNLASIDFFERGLKSNTLFINAPITWDEPQVQRHHQFFSEQKCRYTSIPETPRTC